MDVAAGEQVGARGERLRRVLGEDDLVVVRRRTVEAEQAEPVDVELDRPLEARRYSTSPSRELRERPLPLDELPLGRHLGAMLRVEQERVRVAEHRVGRPGALSVSARHSTGLRPALGHVAERDDLSARRAGRCPRAPRAARRRFRARPRSSAATRTTPVREVLEQVGARQHRLGLAVACDDDGVRSRGRSLKTWSTVSRGRRRRAAAASRPRPPRRARPGCGRPVEEHALVQRADHVRERLDRRVADDRELRDPVALHQLDRAPSFWCGSQTTRSGTPFSACLNASTCSTGRRGAVPLEEAVLEHPVVVVDLREVAAAAVGDRRQDCRSGPNRFADLEHREDGRAARAAGEDAPPRVRAVASSGTCRGRRPARTRPPPTGRSSPGRCPCRSPRRGTDGPAPPE